MDYGMSEEVVRAQTSEMTGGAKSGVVRKVKLLGRERNVVREGRKLFVVIKGEKVSFAKAKEMDAAAKKAAKAAPAKSKKAKKPKA